MYLYNCFFSLFLNLFGGCYALPNWARPIFSGSKNLPQICTDRFSGKLTVNRNSRTQAIMGQSALPIKLGNLLFGPDRSEQSTFNLEPSEPSLSGCIISASLLFSVLLGRMHNIEYHLSFGCPWLPIEYGIYWNIDTQSSLAPPQPLDSLYIYTPVFPTSAGQMRSLMGIHPWFFFLPSANEGAQHDQSEEKTQRLIPTTAKPTCLISQIRHRSQFFHVLTTIYTGYSMILHHSEFHFPIFAAWPSHLISSHLRWLDWLIVSKIDTDGIVVRQRLNFFRTQNFPQFWWQSIISMSPDFMLNIRNWTTWACPLPCGLPWFTMIVHGLPQLMVSISKIMFETADLEYWKICNMMVGQWVMRILRIPNIRGSRTSNKT